MRNIKQYLLQRIIIYWWALYRAQLALVMFSLGIWGVAVTILPFEIFSTSEISATVFFLLAVNLWAGLIMEICYE